MAEEVPGTVQQNDVKEDMQDDVVVPENTDGVVTERIDDEGVVEVPPVEREGY